MAQDHPFQNLFASLHRPVPTHADDVNAQAKSSLLGTLKVTPTHLGRCIMLKAPRAGHGKTHLLSQVQHELAMSHEFIALHPTSGCHITPSTVLNDLLHHLLRPLPASGGLTRMDLVARHTFARALQPLVMSGEVPCQDRETAISALQRRPIETFDFHHPHAMTARWAKENFEILGLRLSLEIAQRLDLSRNDVSPWVNAMFQYASTPLDDPQRMQISWPSGGDLDESSLAFDLLAALLNILTSLMRVVLVADELEGFTSEQSASVKFATLVASLRQSVPQLDLIVSLNEDVWQHAFLPHLSAGLLDRLSEVLVSLEPLKAAEMIALLESRSPGFGEKLLPQIMKGSPNRHARGLLQAAEQAWRSLESAAQSENPPPSPSTVESSFVNDPPPAEIVVHEETPAQSPPDATDTQTQDRVDDLLRQFRERYGKTGL